MVLDLLKLGQDQLWVKGGGPLIGRFRLEGGHVSPALPHRMLMGILTLLRFKGSPVREEKIIPLPF